MAEVACLIGDYLSVRILEIGRKGLSLEESEQRLFRIHRNDYLSTFLREQLPTLTARSSSSGFGRQLRAYAWQLMQLHRMPSRKSWCSAWR